MKLHIKNNPAEVFDAPRGIALALISAGVVAEVLPKPIAIGREVKWSLCKANLSDDFYLRVSCPVCGTKGSIFGHVEGRIPPFLHCGRKDEAPEALANEFFRFLATLKPRKRGTPPTNQYAVGLL